MIHHQEKLYGFLFTRAEFRQWQFPGRSLMGGHIESRDRTAPEA
jgi:hypothetical protein